MNPKKYRKKNRLEESMWPQVYLPNRRHFRPFVLLLIQTIVAWPDCTVATVRQSSDQPIELTSQVRYRARTAMEQKKHRFCLSSLSITQLPGIRPFTNWLGQKRTHNGLEQTYVFMHGPLCASRGLLHLLCKWIKIILYILFVRKSVSPSRQFSCVRVCMCACMSLCCVVLCWVVYAKAPFSHPNCPDWNVTNGKTICHSREWGERSGRSPPVMWQNNYATTI